jgi:hypothetical protein
MEAAVFGRDVRVRRIGSYGYGSAFEFDCVGSAKC